VLAGLHLATARVSVCDSDHCAADVVNLLASGDRAPRLVFAIQRIGENQANQQSGPSRSIIPLFPSFLCFIMH
jgi:hypothetical protein